MTMPQRFPWIRGAAVGIAVFPAFLAMTSCVVEPPDHEVLMEGGHPEASVFVHEPPPPPRDEVVVGVAPGPNVSWVGGYWAWHHSDWYWVPGRWAARPRPNAVWVPGRWQASGRGHVWVGGQWH